MAATISCKSVSPSTVSARVCSSIWGSSVRSRSRIRGKGWQRTQDHDVTPRGGWWIDQRGPPYTMWVRATDGPLNTLVASPNLGLLGFETPAVIELAYWTGSNIASRSQTGSKADQGGSMKLHAHCAERGEFFGREQGFKDSANNPACSDRARTLRFATRNTFSKNPVIPAVPLPDFDWPSPPRPSLRCQLRRKLA